MTTKATRNIAQGNHGRVYVDEYFCTSRVQWRVLPTKANRDMEQAGADAAREYLERNGHNNLWMIYEAMTAAAPKPPASTEPVVVALVAEDRHQLTDVIQCDGVHSLPVGTELIDRAAYDLSRAEILELTAELAKAKSLLHTASVHLSRWVDMDDAPRQQIIQFLEGIDTPVERDEREAFEKFCVDSFNRCCNPTIPMKMELMLAARSGEKYTARGWSDMWKGWKARAALERKG
ncbi:MULTISPECIES: hypothetical protein [unclassified Pseudomonas]|uniref:hypothetical protein n=1 Tax=unclassified Pseudomonas TaxID=196821 RepID=UPI000C87E6C1|nr:MULTISPECIES: hypothetical protein [unclassified Pseudomonas]PNA93663.1 hypothetical protein C1X74_21145 [Pseudomonas sp. GW460-5]PNB56136.1 hypothetical protein C1X73_19920 [Pseudomonas sp. FW305-130]